MRDPVETAELLAFTRAVEARSLSRAAAELGVPRATLGRRLARLEERLGVRLLRRTTRALALTDAGVAFHRHARIVLDAVAQAEQSIRRGAGDAVVRGTLRVSIPPTLEETFQTLVCEFATAHPEVEIHVYAAARHVDLVREGFDLALRAGVDIEPGLVARTLSRGRVVAVASPAYLARRGTPRTARDLRRHALLLLLARDELPQTHWPRVDGGKVSVEGHFTTNDILMLVEAAVRGLGVALLPSLLVDPLIDDGRLVHVLRDVIGAETRVALVYPDKELLPPQVRAFIDAVVAWAPPTLRPRSRRAKR